MVKKKSQKSLTKWTNQKWDYISKADKKKPKSKRDVISLRVLEQD